MSSLREELLRVGFKPSKKEYIEIETMEIENENSKENGKESSKEDNEKSND